MINGVVCGAVNKFGVLSDFYRCPRDKPFGEMADERRYHRWPLLSEVGCNATRPHTVRTVRQ